MDAFEIERMAQLESTHWWFRGKRALLMDILRERCARLGDTTPRFLDLGSGTGANAVAFCALGNVVALEPAIDALRYARAHQGPMYVRGEGTRLPFAARSFHAVVASDVLEHIADDTEVVREVARVLGPHGVFVFTVPARQEIWSGHDEALGHQRRYRPATIRRLLEDAGFRVGWLSYWNTALFPFAALRRLADRHLRPEPHGSDVGPVGALATRALVLLLRLESLVARRIGLPIGLSLVGWAETKR